jgi:putative ABC transport system ATP-binding protein
MEVTSLYREPEAASSAIEWPALECVDVFKLYRSGPVETVALRGLDLRVERGEFVAVLGRSGSGKSTFLHLAAGLDDASAGEVRAFGQPLGRLTERQLASYRATTVALVLQSDNLWGSLTARENVVASLKLAGSRDAGSRADAALAQFGLDRRAAHHASALSGGEQQRVAVARALVHDPLLVLADEPTGNLDLETGKQVLDLLDTLTRRAGKNLLMVTHSPEVVGLADRVFRITEGRLVEETKLQMQH